MKKVFVSIRIENLNSGYYKLMGEILTVRHDNGKPNCDAMDALCAYAGASWAEHWVGTNEAHVVDRIKRAILEHCNLDAEVIVVE